VLDDGEGVDSPRVRRAAGHAAAVVVHAGYEFPGRVAAAAGVSEVAYQPAGDIERELRAFARLAPSVTAPSAWPR
jgi:hypothetical protein